MQYKFDNVWFPERRVFISEKHTYAFLAWETARILGWITPGSTLIHVDAHQDNLHDRTSVPGLYDIKTIEDAMQVTQHLDIADFIIPSVACGTLDHVLYVARDSDLDPFEHAKSAPIVGTIPTGRTYDGVWYHFISEFRVAMERDELSRFINGRSLILDLDLDYFAIGTNVFTMKLPPDNEIRADLEYLRDMCDWSTVTVAISPIYCGGNENAKHLLELFLDVFDLDLKTALPWKIK